MYHLTGDDAISKPKRTLLPVLTVLFVISYGLLTMLVVEQARTIDSQRSLIGLLFGDSVQLSSIKAKAVQKQNSEARAQAQMKAPPAQVTPRDSQVQSPSPQATTPQVTPRTDTGNRNSNKHRRPLPQKPPKDTSDEGDERRMLISI